MSGADPYMSSIAGALTIQGVQSQGVAACIKHLVGNEQEHFRGGSFGQAYSANIDDRTLHEVYGLPFIAGIEAGVASVMCAYNRVNQTASCGNSKLLNGFIKGELDFQGPIISDWAALYAGVDSALAGLDVNMPGFATYSDYTNQDSAEFVTSLWFVKFLTYHSPSKSKKSLWGANLLTAVNNGVSLFISISIHNLNLSKSVPMSRLDDMITRTMAGNVFPSTQRTYLSVS